jgi:ATP-dependent Clp protease ATP-binding subunit ClpC
MANLTLHSELALALARKEAERLGNNYIGAEHLFLGMTGVAECSAVNVLKKLGFELAVIRGEVEKRSGPGKSRSESDEFPMTPRVRRILKLAAEQADKMDPSKDAIGTEHILLGFVLEGNSIPARVLQDCNLTVEKVRWQMRADD